MLLDLLEDVEKISKILFNLEEQNKTDTEKYQTYLKLFDNLQERISDEYWKRNQSI